MLRLMAANIKSLSIIKTVQYHYFRNNHKIHNIIIKDTFLFSMIDDHLFCKIFLILILHS